MLTRDDLLKELELLPVWTLRTPMPSNMLDTSTLEASMLVPSLEAPATNTNLNAPEELPSVTPTTQLAAEASAALTEKVLITEAQRTLFQVFESDEGDYVFLLAEEALATEASQLLRNMMLAMRIKFKPMDEVLDVTQLLLQTTPKVIIAMGEATAQALLNTHENLTNLRGQAHTLQNVTVQNVAVIVTYDLRHLLQHLPDKAKAWDDLRMALQMVKDLKSAI